jgi:hypothetical protein
VALRAAPARTNVSKGDIIYRPNILAWNEIAGAVEPPRRKSESWQDFRGSLDSRSLLARHLLFCSNGALRNQPTNVRRN